EAHPTTHGIDLRIVPRLVVKTKIYAKWDFIKRLNGMLTPFSPGTMTYKRRADKMQARRILIDETTNSESDQAGDSPSGSLEDYQVDTSDTD
ncbi:hypothetical protein HAX54_015129, partial [Datura stramonium]|nr:hypothetical protein [Datura stramonium]